MTDPTLFRARKDAELLADLDALPEAVQESVRDYVHAAVKMRREQPRDANTGAERALVAVARYLATVKRRRPASGSAAYDLEGALCDVLDAAEVLIARVRTGQVDTVSTAPAIDHAGGAEAACRRRVRGLVARGVPENIIAARMGVSDSWLSKWLRGDRVRWGLTLNALERFEAYEAELAARRTLQLVRVRQAGA